MTRRYKQMKKMSMFLIVCMITTLVGGVPKIAFSATMDLMDISRTTTAANVQNGSTFDVNYTITPKPIPVSDQVSNKEKDIVLVMDTSVSMKWIPEEDNQTPGRGQKSRLTIVKEVANSFVTKFQGDSKTNISLVKFNKNASTVCDFTNMSTGNVTNLNNTINALDIGSNTNTGDGLRLAYYALNNVNGHDKYIILMTDGGANTWSVNGNGNYFMQSGDPNYCYYNGEQDSRGVIYATNVASDKIAKTSIKSFIVGFGATASSNNQQIAVAAKGTYYAAQDEASVTALYSKMQKIIATGFVGSANFQETISTNLQMMDTGNLPYGVKQVGNQIQGTINNIAYTLSADKTCYQAQPITFTVTYKANAGGSYTLGDNNLSYVDYSVPNYTAQRKILNKLVINGVILPEVGIQVVDTTGNVGEKYNALVGDTNKRVDKVLNPSVFLQGDAYSNMSVNGNNIDFFRYQFVNQGSTPSVMPSSGWNNMPLTGQSYNDDVETDKPGNLKWRSYDVNHIGTMSNEKSWNDPQNTFKCPSDATSYKPTSISSTVNGYGSWGNIAPYTVQDISNNSFITVNKKWSTNSVFMSYLNIGGDYKEASKFWGYIKVDADGDYQFGVTSDDGCRGFITVDGETNAFTDMFKVQGSTFGTTAQVYKLKKNQYYPIHLEYFNWGGEAEFRMVYSKNSTVTGGSGNVPANWFYPSKSNAPGEYAQNVFMGSQGVKLPQLPGNYYVAFQTGKGSDVQREGFYGPFIVENRLTLSKGLDGGGNIVQLKDGFGLQYTITPNDVPIRDSFKDTNGQYMSKISLGDITLKDLYPQDIVIDTTKNAAVIVNGKSSVQNITVNDQNSIVNGENIIVKSLETKLSSPINYTLNTVNGQQIYKASPLIIQIPLKANVVKDNYVLSDLGKSILTYTELNGKMKGQMEFPQFNLKAEQLESSEIIHHALYMNGVFGRKTTYNVAKTFGIDLGVEFRTNLNNPMVTLTVNNKIAVSNLRLYIVDDITHKSTQVQQAIISKSIPKEDTKTEYQISVPTAATGHYILVYKAMVDGSAPINVVDNKAKIENSPEASCSIHIVDLPDLK